MNILVSYGTRPEWIKIHPLLKKMKGVIPYKVLFTGQHTDIAHGDYDYKIAILEGENRLDTIVKSILDRGKWIFDKIDYVMVHGDTTSAMAIAMSAFHHDIPVIHLEAGLRTYDFKNPYPEEFNRQMIDKLADILLCPTKLNYQNIKKEKCKGDAYIVGNTGLDNLLGVKSEYGNTVLITMHRRENHAKMDEWFQEISKIALANKDLYFVIPLHPNPNVQKHRNLLNGVRIIKPLQYEDMIKIVSNCKFIISDSGGIQEEASFLNKRVIVCRKTTERPETLGTNSLLCLKPSDLNKLFQEMNEHYIIHNDCPYGNGNSSEKIVNILNDYSYTKI